MGARLPLAGTVGISPDAHCPERSVAQLAGTRVGYTP